MLIVVGTPIVKKEADLPLATMSDISLLCFILQHGIDQLTDSVMSYIWD
jgi:hypothetical protein